jgi:hypothetical protein
VLANCADPNGEAFVKWPGRDHWWIYLSERTRLPKSSLFRHLNTLVALGLGERAMQVLADGSRRPTFKLNMEAAFDIEQPEDAERYQQAFAKASSENESPVGTGHDDHETADENDSDISHSQEPENTIAPQSPVGTGISQPQSPVGTGPFPVLGPQKDSLKLSKDSPLPPSGGVSAPVDELFDQFVAAWGEPIPKMALARSAWDHAPSAKRGEVVAGARGYWAWLKAHPKPPSAQSAQSFIRDAAGWAQWLRYAPQSDGAAPSMTTAFARESREGRAIAALYEIAGKGDFLRQFMLRNHAINYSLPITPRLLALADAPPRTDWAELGRQQAGAWEGLLSEAVHVQVRNHLREGSRAPWPWPPRKDGTLSQAGPSDELMTDQDFENFK